MNNPVETVINAIKQKLDILEEEHESLSEHIQLKQDEIKSLDESISLLQRLQNGIKK